MKNKQFALVLFIGVIFTSVGCSLSKVRKCGDVDGRPVYNVYLMDGRRFEYMYREEVRNGINTGTWTYDETMK